MLTPKIHIFTYYFYLCILYVSTEWFCKCVCRWAFSWLWSSVVPQQGHKNLKPRQVNPIILLVNTVFAAYNFFHTWPLRKTHWMIMLCQVMLHTILWQQEWNCQCSSVLLCIFVGLKWHNTETHVEVETQKTDRLKSGNIKPMWQVVSSIM